MLEEAKVNGLFVRLKRPGDGVFLLDIDPSHQVVLQPVWSWSVQTDIPNWRGQTMHAAYP